MPQDKLLDFVRGKPPAFSLEAIAAFIELTPRCLSRCSLGRQQRALDVIAITPAVIDGMGRREGNALRREQQPRKQAWMLGASSSPLAAGVHCELSLNLVPGLSVDDGFMLSFVAATLVRNAADIDRIGKNAVEVTAAERGSPRPPAIEHRAQLGSKP